MSEQLVEIHRARNVIERDSIMAHLKSEGIDSFTGQRDVIVNLTDHVNLGLEGYSALFEGYRIYVQAENKDRSQQLIRQQNLVIQNTPQEPTDENRELNKFVSSCLFSVLLPGIMNLLALFWLVKGLQKHQSLTRVKWTLAVFIWCSSMLLFMSIVNRF